jgi:hypothetical protein
LDDALDDLDREGKLTEKELDDALDVLDISLCHSVTKRGRTGR